jgi:RND family efflux transporter MFP subunit
MTTGNTLLGKPEHNHQLSRVRFFVILLLIVMLGLAAVGIFIRWTSHQELKTRTEDEAIPTVAVVKPAEGPATDEIVLPGTMSAFVDAPIYARTDGYLKAWYFDIGARVKKGDLLAVIETPELDQQLDQARAAVGTAKANYDLSIVTNRRYQVLVRTNAVSQQEADQSASNEASQKAQLDAAIANVRHYEALQSFEKLYAPFDGVVTERNTDVGQLVSSGIGASAGSGDSATSGRELFHIASTDRLRTFIPVPQAQAIDIHDNQEADLALVEFPGRKFAGHVARTSRSIDVASRTLLTEVDIDNPKGELKPGAYVTVHLTVPGSHSTVRVPTNVLIFRSQGMQIGVVGEDNVVHLKKIDIGRDFGTQVEILAGATADENVVLNPPDSLMDGQKVKIGKSPSTGATASQSSDQGSDKEKSTNNTTDSKKGNSTRVQSSSSSGETVKAGQKTDNSKDGSSTGGQKGDNNPGGMTAPGSDGNDQK